MTAAPAQQKSSGGSGAGSTTMRASQFRETGPPAVLEMVSVPVPDTGSGDVLIKVLAVGVNRADVLTRSGALPFAFPLPHILGADVVGRVVAHGDLGAGPPLGTRVLVNAYQSCGACEYCLLGRNNICVKSQILGLQRPGGYAQFVAVPSIDAIPLPDSVSDEQAVALPVAGLTAWHLLLERAIVAPGDDVLVIGGTSGVGSIAIQVARLAGARRVFSTVGSQEKVAVAERLGSDAVFLHSDPKFGRSIKAATGGRGVDVVVEHVGEATWAGSVASLARGGRIAECGGHSGFIVPAHLAVLSAKENSVIGSYGGTRSGLMRLLEATASGRIVPLISEVMPLEEAPRAHALMEGRGHSGKIVLRVSD